jgi:hypothetical protein
MNPLYSIGAKSGIHFARRPGVFAGDFGPSPQSTGLKW